MGILHVSNVSKRFRRGEETIAALDGVSFSIDRPEIVALAGPSGSGKSTLLNVLARFDDIDTGKILIDDEDIAGIPETRLDHFRSRKLGFVFQGFNLIKVLSAAENVELALVPHGHSKSARRTIARTILTEVGLAQRLDHRPAQLSGGQQQRVAIARALAGNPSLVIADEPTGNLDSHTAQDILGLMQRLNKDMGTTFLVATHDHRVMDAADRVITMKDGKVST
jgi:putative ABC transport system ATP-binding protein